MTARATIRIRPLGSKRRRLPTGSGDRRGLGPPPRSRHAFTMPEISMVVLLIGVLVGLLLPAVQNFREMARRTQCLSHMSQWALAIESYHQTHRAYPAGTVGRPNPVRNFPDDMHHSWLLRVVGYLDQQPLAARIDWQRSVYDPANQPLYGSPSWGGQLSAPLPLLLCPSSRETGGTNYAAVYSGDDAAIAEDSSGSFALNQFLRLQDIEDGLGTTLFLGEKLTFTAHDLGWTSGTHATLRTTGVRLNDPAERELIRGPAGRGWGWSQREAADWPAYGWFKGDGGESWEEFLERLEGEEGVPLEEAYDRFGASVEAWDDADLEEWWQDELDESVEKFRITNFPKPGIGAFTGSGYGGDVGRGFSSDHPQGANFVFGDGHARFIAETIDAEVYAQMGRRADGRPLVRPAWLAE